MSEALGDLGAGLWFLGATFGILVSPLLLVALGLAGYGVVKWKGVARAAATLPLATAIVAVVVMQVVDPRNNLAPPFYIGAWYLFLVIYSLTVLVVRAGRMAHRKLQHDL